MDEQPLEEEQVDLLAQLVRIYRSLPREKRQDFLYQQALTRTSGARPLAEVQEALKVGIVSYQGDVWRSMADVPKNYNQDLVVHPETSNASITVLQHDIDALLYHDLIRLRDDNHLFVTPKGLSFDFIGQAGDSAKPNIKAQTMNKLIFISHKETDVVIASKLVDYLLAALEVSDEEVLCTSVPGHQLAFGMSIPEQLRDGLSTSTAIIGLLTQDSIKSSWVTFELGAAWGLKKMVVPLLGPGLVYGDLPGPLSNSPAVQISKDDAMNRLSDAVKQISESLSIGQKSGGKAQARLQDFVSAFASSASVVSDKEIALLPASAIVAPSLPDLSEQAKIILLEAAQDTHGIIMSISSLGHSSVQTNGKAFGQVGDAREKAKWNQALKQLMQLGFTEPVGSKGEVSKVTDSGYEMADKLKE